MAASPEFYKPPPAFSSPSPCDDEQQDYSVCYHHHHSSSSSCRTPTGSGISYLKEPTTCPPAPRKPPAPPACKKRLFSSSSDKQAKEVISLRLDELERIFRPHPTPPNRQDYTKRCRRSARNQQHKTFDDSSSTATTNT